MKATKYELYIEYVGWSWIYYNTNRETIREAFIDFEKTLEEAGISDDNAQPVRMEFRPYGTEDILELWELER